MRCFVCRLDKDPSERGWVTVLAGPGQPRIHYCPDCMAELMRFTSRADDPAESDRDDEKL